MTKEQKFLLLIVLIIAGASVTYYYTQSGTPVSSDTPVTQGTPAAQDPTPTTPVNPVVTSQKYSTDVTYNTPEEGKETIHVAITMKDTVIENIAFTYDTPTKRESKFNITNFEKAFQASSFVGKKLTEVSVSRLGGASLTSGAFMEAIKNIDSQTKNG